MESLSIVQSPSDIIKSTTISLKQFQEIENTIKDHLNSFFPICLDKAIEEAKNSNTQLKFNESAKHIYWIFNKKTVHTANLGDLTTPSIWKFFHDLFPKTEFDEENTNNEKQEREFILKLGQEFSELLNANLNDSIKHHVTKYELKNNYLNIYLINEAKDFIDQNIKQNKPKPKHNTYSIQPIGTFHSCFPEKFSVPRQGGLLSKTKGKIVLDSKIVDISCIDGIEEFEYFWVIYIFHLHTDFKGTKISPPKFDQTTNKNSEKKKLGIFATRTPHRINSIGLTLVKLDKVQNGEVYISGIDMVEGTPIVDIKPYHHLEKVELTKYPSWILNAEKDVETQKNQVEFKSQAVENLKKYLPDLEFYSDYEEVFSLIKELLEIDPHSKYTKRKNEKLLYAFYIDKLNVIYEFDSPNKLITIIDIEYVNEYKKLRNKDWLKEYSANMTQNNENKAISDDDK